MEEETLNFKFHDLHKRRIYREINLYMLINP